MVPLRKGGEAAARAASGERRAASGERRAARLLITTPDRRVLLFRFVHRSGALAGQTFWATPGGGLERGATFPDAAIQRRGGPMISC
nr:NUDIX domain-containing protein [Caballeronia sp. NK8]